jgi:transposase
MCVMRVIGGGSRLVAVSRIALENTRVNDAQAPANPGTGAITPAFAAALAQMRRELEARFQAQIAELTQALAQAKSTIRALLAQLHGVRSERCDVVLTAEGQTVIDPAWGTVNATPAPVTTPTAVTVPADLRQQRTARDRRGLVQRHPHLPITEVDAPLPTELAEQTATGAVTTRRSNRFVDELVLPEGKPFIRRVWAQDVVRPTTGALVLTAPLPERIVPGGTLSDESIHTLMIGKFLDAVPFHRQLIAWSRRGVDVAKQTVNDACTAWTGLFAPLAETLRALVWQAPVVHADESWARRQAAGACARGNLWTMLGDDVVAYAFTADRTHARALEIVPAGFRGYLVRDAWQGWIKLEHIRQAGCNAHARRPFAAYAKIVPDHGDAQAMLTLYAELYRAEHHADDGPPDGLLARRQRIRAERSRPIMQRIRSEAERIAAAQAHSHELAVGARYILNHFTDLCRFLDDPLLPPDNNAAENALRINALIRKNSLFFGSEAAGDRAAIALTVLHSCRLARVEPHTYLAHVTPALLRHRSGRPQALDQLVPKAIAPLLAPQTSR